MLRPASTGAFGAPTAPCGTSAVAEASAGLFADGLAMHSRAVGKHGLLERRFRVGGRTLSLRFAGEAMASRLTPALEHLATATAAEPDLHVHVWDTVSTGIAMPTPPWPREAYTPRGEILSRSTDGVLTAFALGSYTLSMLDLATRAGLYWIHDAGRLPPWESAAPLRGMLGWWAAANGGQLAHAAAVGIGGAGVLLAGPGGSGKSTTALACLERGFRYAGDDYVLLQTGPDGQPSAYGLYCTGKLARNGRLAGLPGAETPCLPHDPAWDQGKMILLLEEAYRGRMAERLALKAVVVPVLSEATALRRVSPVEALRALAPTTLFQLPGAGSASLSFLAEAVRRMPAYRLELGPDLDEVAAALRQLLEDPERRDG